MALSDDDPRAVVELLEEVYVVMYEFKSNLKNNNIQISRQTAFCIILY